MKYLTNITYSCFKYDLVVNSNGIRVLNTWFLFEVDEEELDYDIILNELRYVCKDKDMKMYANGYDEKYQRVPFNINADIIDLNTIHGHIRIARFEYNIYDYSIVAGRVPGVDIPRIGDLS